MATVASGAGEVKRENRVKPYTGSAQAIPRSPVPAGSSTLHLYGSGVYQPSGLFPSAPSSRLDRQLCHPDHIQGFADRQVTKVILNLRRVLILPLYSMGTLCLKREQKALSPVTGERACCSRDVF